MADEAVNAFAVTAPGLSPIVATELRELGIGPEAVSGAGVEFRATPSQLYAANLHSRVATRILVRVATFHAAHFKDLERGLTKVDWAPWLAPAAPCALRVSCRKSRLYHSGAVADRVAARFGDMGLAVFKPPAEDDESTEAQVVIVRLERDVCTISVDSSGALLHRRGYRLAVAKAPLRETIAAAMLALLWGDQGASFVDPMCGSGTLPIEAALRARKVPPGWNRHFAFEAWPSFEERVWRSVRATAAARIQTRAPGQIVGFDRDAGAIEAAVANAARAGVQDDVSFERRALSTARPPTERGKGLVAVNPPYGERVTGGPELRNLYARLGDVVREHFEGWAFGILAADPRLVSQLRLPLQQRFATTNGGIRVAYWTMGEPAARA